MKKTVSLFLALLMTLSLLAGCGQGSVNGPSASAAPTGTAAIDACRTLGDIIALDGVERTQYALLSHYCIYVFELGGATYRAVAEVSEEAMDPLWDLEWDDPEHETKLNKLIAPLEILRSENLTDGIPSQEELDVWIGKTGQDMFDADWYNSGWNLDAMEFWMNHDAYAFTVVMEGKVTDYASFDDEDVGALVIKSVTCTGIGDATNVELDDDGNLVG